MYSNLNDILNGGLKDALPKKYHESLSSVAKSICPKTKLLRKAKTQQSIDKQLKDLEGLLSQLREYQDRISSYSLAYFKNLLNCLFYRLFCNFRPKTID